MGKIPSISFLVCTYNNTDLVQRCLDSILKQKYNGEIEILIIDGGSNKETMRLIKNYKNRFKNIKVLHNKEKLPEGYGRGKWLGWKKASGRFVAIVDQDNELQERDWISEMLKPFKKEEIFGCACRLKIDKNDSLTNQYVALIGTDPFFAYRSLDGIINLKKFAENKEGDILIELKKDDLTITGGNCFVYRKKCLNEVGGYVQDIENIKKLVDNGHKKIAIPKNASTHHLATSGFFDFLRKKKKWAETYKRKDRHFSYAGTKIERKKLLINLLFIFAIIPNIFIAGKKFIETKEKAWLLHPILSLLTGIIYFIFSLQSFIIEHENI